MGTISLMASGWNKRSNARQESIICFCSSLVGMYNTILEPSLLQKCPIWGQSSGWTSHYGALWGHKPHIPYMGLYLSKRRFCYMGGGCAPVGRTPKLGPMQFPWASHQCVPMCMGASIMANWLPWGPKNL